MNSNTKLRIYGNIELMQNDLRITLWNVEHITISINLYKNYAHNNLSYSIAVKNLHYPTYNTRCIFCSRHFSVRQTSTCRHKCYQMKYGDHIQKCSPELTFRELQDLASIRLKALTGQMEPLTSANNVWNVYIFPREITVRPSSTCLCSLSRISAANRNMIFTAGECANPRTWKTWQAAVSSEREWDNEEGTGEGMMP